MLRAKERSNETERDEDLYLLNNTQVCFSSREFDVSESRTAFAAESFSFTKRARFASEKRDVLAESQTCRK